MKRKKLFLVIVAIAAAITPLKVEAQKLGNILKKGQEVLEKISAPKTESSQKRTSTDGEEVKNVRTNSIALGNGIEMTNPIAEYIDVVPVGLYGVSTSENYGNAYLVLKVTMKEPANKASFGGSINNEKMVAVDANGKVYNTDSNGTFSFDTPEGIPVSVIINQPALTFTGIKKSIEVMPMVKFGILIDAYHKGNLTLKNVPIYWDKSPEE